MSTEAAIVLRTDDPEQTEELAALIGRACNGGELIVLRGELGAGKTVFVRGLVRGLGGDPREVRSPSYTLHHRHPGRLVLHHLDVYFTESALDLERTPVQEFLNAGDVVAVEWGDRFSRRLATDRIVVELEHVSPVKRHVRIGVEGPRSAEWRVRAESELSFRFSPR